MTYPEYFIIDLFGRTRIAKRINDRGEYRMKYLDEDEYWAYTYPFNAFELTGYMSNEGKRIPSELFVALYG